MSVPDGGGALTAAYQIRAGQRSGKLQVIRDQINDAIGCIIEFHEHLKHKTKVAQNGSV
jgi:hypothetical protein